MTSGGSDRQPTGHDDQLPVFGPSRRREDPGLDYPKRYSRWALWGCVSLILIAVFLGGGFLLVTLQRPGFPAWMAFAEDFTACRENMTALSGALERYHSDKGRLPDGVEELYPTYLADSERLACPAAPPATMKGRRTTYRLMPGVAWGKGRGIVLACPLHPVPNTLDAPEERRLNYVPLIRQDGSVDGVTGRLKDLGVAPDPGAAVRAPARAPAR